MAQESVEAKPIPAPPAQTLATDAPAGFRSWWMVSVLFVVFLAAYVDRAGLNLLVTPIKAEFGLNDLQMSLLLGFAFTMTYSVVGVPAGYLADMVNRKALVCWAIVIWSSMSAFCGFSASFWQLFIGRSGLATAEAVMAPTGNSLIRDAFPPALRGRAFSIFTLAAPLGAAGGILVAGSLISLGDSGFFHNWPILGHFKTWQLVLAVPGMCTLPLVLLMLSVHEPARRVSTALTVERPSWADTMRYFINHAWVYLPFFGSLMISRWAGDSFTSWEPTALIRGWGLQAASIAHITGTLGLILGTAGLLGGSYAMDTLTKRGIADAPLRVMCLGYSVSFVCNMTILHVPVDQPWIIYALIGVRALFAGPGAIGMALTISSITPGRLMGRMTAFMFLSTSLLASTGATMVALVSKYFFTGPLAIIPAMQFFYVPFQTIGIGLCILAALRVQRFYRVYEGGAG